MLGSRRASDYGIEIARSLARGLAASGVSVAASLTDGIAAAAHAGALEAGAGSIAVMGGGLGVACPPRRRSLYQRILHAGCAVSELPQRLRGTPLGAARERARCSWNWRRWRSSWRPRRRRRSCSRRGSRWRADGSSRQSPAASPPPSRAARTRCCSAARASCAGRATCSSCCIAAAGPRGQTLVSVGAGTGACVRGRVNERRGLAARAAPRAAPDPRSRRYRMRHPRQAHARGRGARAGAAGAQRAGADGAARPRRWRPLPPQGALQLDLVEVSRLFRYKSFSRKRLKSPTHRAEMMDQLTPLEG